MPPKRKRTGPSAFARSSDEDTFAGYVQFDDDYEEISIETSQEERDRQQREATEGIPAIHIPDFDDSNIFVDSPTIFLNDDTNQPSPKRRKVTNECDEQIEHLQELITVQDNSNWKSFVILMFCHAAQINPHTELKEDGLHFKNAYFQDIFENFLLLEEGQSVTLNKDNEVFEIMYEVLETSKRRWKVNKEILRENAKPNQPFVVDFQVLDPEGYVNDAIFWNKIYLLFVALDDFQNVKEKEAEMMAADINTLQSFYEFISKFESLELVHNYPFIYQFNNWLHESVHVSQDRLSKFIDDWRTANDCIPFIKKYVDQTRSKDVPQEFIDFINKGNFFLFSFSFFCRFNTYPVS